MQILKEIVSSVKYTKIAVRELIFNFTGLFFLWKLSWKWS